MLNDRAISVGPFDDRLAFNGMTQKSERGKENSTVNGSLDEDAIQDL